ncbi:MAG: HepT-like ribonuclease domain-containing protein [Bauldia sp.]
MASRPVIRLQHIKQSIDDIRKLLDGKAEDDLRSQPVKRAALERFLEIISEASRHLPQEWKDALGADVPWPKIAAFGNVLRHVYDNVEVSVLWSVYVNDLGPLEAAIDAMLAAHSPKDPSP